MARVAIICGAVFFLLAFHLNSAGADRRAAYRLFVYSIVYLFVLFAALLRDHGSGSSSLMRPSSHRGARGTGNFSEV